MLKTHALSYPGGGLFYNEKMAFEALLTFSWVGKRAVLEIEEDDLPTIFDPLLSASYTGVEGGFVVHILEKDGHLGRTLGFFTKCPVIVGEDLLELSMEVSESFKIPVLHISKENIKDRVKVIEDDTFNFNKDPGRWAATPRFRYVLHRKLNQKLSKIEKFFSEKGDLVRWEGEGELAVSESRIDGYRTLVVPFSHPLPRNVILEMGGKARLTDSFPIMWQMKGYMELKLVKEDGGSGKIQIDGRFIYGRHSIGVASGMERFSGKGYVAVMEEEDFLHSGIPSLLNAFYNYTPIGVAVRVKERGSMLLSLAKGIGIPTKEVESLEEIEKPGELTLFLWKG